AVPPGDLLLTADAVVSGVHFDLDLVGIDDVGWKALAVNVSDVAAMGGRPLHALVTVAGPLGSVDLDALYDGVLAAADVFACPVVGGDLVAAPVLMVSVAVTGTLDGGPPLLRSGAAPGDLLFVTGPLGSSAAGLELLRAGRGSEAPDLALAHRRPRARVAEGQAARAAGATAMIDLSDGLASDVRHVAEASGVGVALDRVPVAVGVARAMGDDGVAAALGGGEDYELLFAAPDTGRVEDAFSAEVVSTVAATLHDLGVRRLVVDPVFVSKHGDTLLADDAVKVLREVLLPIATVVTPNLPEASRLVGAEVATRADMEVAGRELAALGPDVVVVKGGHLHDEEASPDCVVANGEVQWLAGPRLAGRHTHG